ncbi:MAG: hypothetical protein E3J56_05780 [Candidatus Aminicenantes bacterium]|nr:MAG: hypothetical protein E3J56_05780 [Candidatus Aminicenantes bacterium]
MSRIYIKELFRKLFREHVIKTLIALACVMAIFVLLWLTWSSKVGECFSLDLGDTDKIEHTLRFNYYQGIWLILTPAIFIGIPASFVYWITLTLVVSKFTSFSIDEVINRAFLPHIPLVFCSFYLVNVYKRSPFFNPILPTIVITLALFFLIATLIRAKKLRWLLLVAGFVVYLSTNFGHTMYVIKEFNGLGLTSQYGRKDDFYSVCRKTAFRGEGALLGAFVQANLKGKLKMLVFPEENYGKREAPVPYAVDSRMVPYMYPARVKKKNYDYTLSSTEYGRLRKQVVASEKGGFRHFRIVKLSTKPDNNGRYAIYQYDQEIFIVPQGWRKLKENK